MAKYIDKQTVLNIITSFRNPYRKEVRIEDVYDAVNKIESVEIIHCKECEHYVNVRNRLTVNGSFGECERFGFHTYDGWYCRNGIAEMQKEGR